MMFQALTDLFTLGDLDKVRQTLLHSSCWKQHDFTAYGYSQIEKQWLTSIEQFGFCDVVEKQEISGEKYSALLLKLSNKEGKLLTISMIFEHNQHYIKRVNCVVDTIGLAAFTNSKPEEALKNLPTSDPLLISQFDHQLHPQSYHAVPKDIVAIPQKSNGVLESWWHIWQANQMASFNEIYGENASIVIAGYQDKLTTTELRNYKLKLINRLNRSYCQLEQIAVDKNGESFAISWMIDGDYNDGEKTLRVRVPVQSFITVKSNKIIDEKLLIDWLAIKKRFSLNTDII